MAFPPQLLQWIKHRMMLRAQADQVAGPAVLIRQGPRMSEQGEVVGFGGATGEDHLAREHLQAAGESLTGVTDRRSRHQPQLMLATRWISPVLVPPGVHGLDDHRVAGRRRLEIKCHRRPTPGNGD